MNLMLYVHLFDDELHRLLTDYLLDYLEKDADYYCLLSDYLIDDLLRMSYVLWVVRVIHLKRRLSLMLNYDDEEMNYLQNYSVIAVVGVRSRIAFEILPYDLRTKPFVCFE